jgi:protein SCO1
MLELANLMLKLGPDADRIKFLFVTVDPERDTPDVLKAYIASFDERIIGLIGTPEETAQITKGYHIYYTTVPIGSGYTINHTAAMLLMDAKGRLVEAISFGEDENIMLQKIRRLIDTR